MDIGTGFTPLLRANNLGRLLGLDNLYIKNDCMNPTWSFKDRVVSVASSVAREFEFDTLACASTGNLANSVSAHAARAGMEGHRLHTLGSGAGEGGGLGRLRADSGGGGRKL